MGEGRPLAVTAGAAGAPAGAPEDGPGLRVTVLGSGTLVPTGVRGPAGYAIEAGGRVLLLDGGSGTLRRLAEAGLDYRSIDHLFYTHIHPDHTGDLVPFLFAQRHIPGGARRRDLQVFGPRGFASFFERLTGIFERWLFGGGYAVEVAELWESGIALPGGVRVDAIPLRHSVAEVGYRITAPDGAVVAYTGDTDVTPAVSELARDVDVLIADCSSPDGQQIEGHLTPGLVGELAAAGRARMVVLSHLYPVCDGVDVAAQCRRRYGGRVVVAHDLMRLEVRAGEAVAVGAAGPPAEAPAGGGAAASGAGTGLPGPAGP
jgi:ribonuclease BN (tRNA processing enzyme)